ncbi:hypothetical protein [Methylobacterium oryzisoli]|uniref:hypothetical protein n=1 Tax=Methylobacterium oryzisoli TaxID=3385502 RepID=UPI0038914577
MWARNFRGPAAFLLLAASCLGAASGALAQGALIAPAPGGRVIIPVVPGSPLTDGSMVFHGNFCGPGQRGSRPVDALDVACMNHDACTPAGGIPSCACNARLQREAAAVARSRRQPADLRDLAALVSQSATVMPCDP